MNRKTILTIVILLSVFTTIIKAGDKEDVMSAVQSTIDLFNKHDVNSYFSNFTADNTEFSYVISPLRYDAKGWRGFIEGTTSLAYVNYHEQDFQVQVYNGNTAVVTGYYTFTWMEKGQPMNYQSGRASMVMIKQDGKWHTAHMHFSKMF